MRLLFERVPAIDEVVDVPLGESDGRIPARTLVAPGHRVGFISYAALR